MANYDKGDITDRERTAAKNQTKISKQNIKDVQNQLKQQIANYDFADRQNRALADRQLTQNSRKDDADRFEAQRDLQAATLGLLGSMGTAMNGSPTGNLMSMLDSRNDKENNTFWAQHQVNQDAVENSYQDSLNQNNVARRDARQSAEKAIRDIRSDWSANLNNINPNLFEQGNVGGDASLSPTTARTINKPIGEVGSIAKAASSAANSMDRAKPKKDATVGSLIPTNLASGFARAAGFAPTARKTTTTTTPRPSDTSTRSDYFSQMMSRFNGR